MIFSELKAKLEESGYSDVKVKRWKSHDWLVFKHLPDITYGRIICTCRVEEVPGSSWEKHLSINNKEVR